MKYSRQFLFRILIVFLFFIPFITSAQNPADVEMADTFRSDGKIYVVIGIMTIILVGLFIYLFAIGKKVSDIEKKISQKK